MTVIAHPTSPAAMLTTRTAVTDRVAAEWLAAHPQTAVTPANLSKTLQQLLTEVFMTGRQRGRGRLSAYALSLLRAAEVDSTEFSSARTFSKTSDMPADHAEAFGRLSWLLAPLAAAIQLTRSRLADAAFGVLQLRGNPLGISRADLRGFVEARVRPHAQQVHERAGYQESAHEYLRLLLVDADRLSDEVVTAAQMRRSRSSRLGEKSRTRCEEYVRRHGAALRDAAHGYGPAGEEIFSDLLLKLTIAHRNNPDLEAGLAFGMEALRNAACAYHQRHALRREVLTEGGEGTEIVDSGCDSVIALDEIVRRLLTTAGSLSAGTDVDALLASDLLARFFFVGPATCDPGRVRLGGHLWELPDAPGGTGFEDALVQFAAELVPGRARAKRIAGLVVKALRGAEAA